MKFTLTLLTIFLTFSFANAQFAVFNPELIKSKGAPITLTTGDFDGDGRKDIAYISENPVTLTVLYAEGDKSFTETLPYTTPIENSNSAALSAGDINKDGKTDIILFDNLLNTSDKIISLISKGRTFEQSTIQTAGTNTFSGFIDILDWDGDSNLDILVLCDSEALQFYKGNSTGQFEKQSISQIGAGQDMEISDLNNDNKLDAIISNQNTLSIYLSDGASYTKSDFTVSNFISEIAVGDLTNDGLKDILVINAVGSPTDNLILFEKNTSNSFTQTVINSSGYLHKGLDIDDFNNDGRMDILIGAIYNNGVNLLLNTGSLNFVLQNINENNVSSSFYAAFEDMDNDSSLEIIALSVTKRIDLFKLNSNNSYELYFTNITGFIASHAAVGDLNKDGNLDIISASLVNYTIVVHYGKEDQTFENSIYYKGTGPITAVELSDVNNDDFPDIVYSSEVAYPGSSGVIRSDGSGGFLTPQQFSPTFGGLNLVVADLDKDGLDDIIYSNAYLRAKGDGSYTKKTFNSPIEAVNLTVGDINNDSYLDVAITDYVKVLYFLNDGTGNFPSSATLKSTGQNSNISLADINSDGKLDFIIPTDISEVSIYFAQSGGTYNQLKLTTSGFIIFNAITADFNNDNKQDLAVGHDDGTIDFFIQDNNNQFSRTSIKSNGSNHLIVADLNHDAKKDLITFSSNGDPIGILYNDSVFEPDAPSNLIVSNRTDKSATISLTKSNGNGRLILVREVGDSRAVPNDGTLFSANSTFGNGDQLGTRNYAVYRGSDQSVNIIGLKEDTEYIVTAFEYSSNKANTIIDYEAIGTHAQFKTKKNQTITVVAISTKTIGDAPFQISFSSTSGLPISASVLSSNASISNNVVTMNAEGPVKLKFTQSGTDDYMPAVDVEITFCVNPVTPTITYASAANGKYSLTSSANSNNIWLKNNVVITGATNQTVEVTTDASYTVKVDYSGCSSTSLPVTNQTINFSSLTTKEEGQPDFSLTATATSSLPVSYEVVSGGISITNSTVKINTPGPAKIKATQTGNSGFFPGHAVEQTFCVNPKTPTVTVTTSGPGQITLTSSSEINNNWLKNGVDINGATNKTFEPEQDGVYTVKVEYSGCSNTSAPTAYLITGLEELFNSVSLYPNPSNGNLIIEWPQRNARIHKITLQDSQGKNHELKYEKIDTHIHVNLIDYPAGLFVLSVHSDSGVLPIKVIKN